MKNEKGTYLTTDYSKPLAIIATIILWNLMTLESTFF